ncbi:MAG: hypothetical protein ACOH1T_10505 [Microbacteriaceae bacterium]
MAMEHKALAVFLGRDPVLGHYFSGASTMVCSLTNIGLMLTVILGASAANGTSDDHIQR